MNGAHGEHSRSSRAPPASASGATSSSSSHYPTHSTPTNAGYRASPYYGAQQQEPMPPPPISTSAASRYAHEDYGGSYGNGSLRPQPQPYAYQPQASPSAAAMAQAQAQAAQHAAAARQARSRPSSQQRIAMEKQMQYMEQPNGASYGETVSPAAAVSQAMNRGSFSSSSTPRHQYSNEPPPATSHRMSGTRKKPGVVTAPPPPPPLEEGDYVWVSDAGALCVPAVVARMGYYYNEGKDSEQPVIVVHTEDGEEREIRDERTLVRLPLSHHPKTKPSLEIHDLSALTLMSSTGDFTRNEVFSTAQLENIVLYTLRSRYRMEQVYTWVDRVLVSINPVMPLPIFTPDHMQAYNKSPNQGTTGSGVGGSTSGGANDTPPHIFAVAQNAIQCMQEAAEDQAVILLGGMGSGKSEAAKLIVQYLCEIGENPVRSDVESDPGVLHPIGQQILHAFTVLEAFGNAATPQNPNSSRFAKMISVEFSRHGYVIGGGFTTHYFEKTRVIDRREQERNFHIFYQVLAGVQHDPTLRDALELNKPASDFALVRTTMGNSDQAANGATPLTGLGRPEDTAAMDARDYRDLMSSFSALRIRKHQRMEIVRIIAAILHLGNVEFVPDTSQADQRSEASTSSSSSFPCALKDPNQIVLAAKLLEVEPVVLDNYFRTRQFFSKDSNNKTVSSLKVVTVSQARKARDTFIRCLYVALFTFLVETLNGILGGIFDRYEKSNIVLNSQGIHVLDIVGFENLDGSGQYNGFDQLCFNYWSEKVHSFYVQNTLATNLGDVGGSESQHVELRLTQKAHFGADLDECLTLFENVPFGIFAQLIEHSKVRSPNDEDLVAKILAGNEGVRAISRPNVGQDVTSEYLTPSKEWRSLFVVEHYGGKVTYSGKGLVARNTLTISVTCAAIMHSSKNAVLHAVGAAQVASASAGGKAKAASNPHSKFVTSTRDLKSGETGDNSACAEVIHQADALLNALAHTGKNFLVCVKPSVDMEEGALDSEFVMQQIRDARLVDLIRASRSVYSVRLTHNHFFRRYKSICGHRGTLESLLRALSAIGVVEEDKFVVGQATVYLTSHQWKKLEHARSLYLNACATMIQRNLVRGSARKKSAQILELMQRVRMALHQKASDEVVHSLNDCVSVLGKRGVENIRVLKEAKLSLSRLDEEAYVESIIDDAQSLGHLALINFAIASAEKWCPHMRIDSLRGLQKQLIASQNAKIKKGESSTVVNERLRESIVENDPDALMAALATLEEVVMESLERKIATMMIIRALEVKSIVESVSSAVTRLSSASSEDYAAMLKSFLTPALKAVEHGLEDTFPEATALLKQLAEQHSGSDGRDDAAETVTVNSAPIDPTALLAALDKAMVEDNLIAAQRVLLRLEALGVPSNKLMEDATKRVENELSGISVASERKLILKFLNIAKVSQDLELLNQAIDAAVDAGLAKWDFNLKNAERERDKLTALAAASGAAVPSTPAQPPARKPTKKQMPLETSLHLLWTTIDEAKLQALKTGIPAELEQLLDAKISRRLKVADVEHVIQRATTASGPNDALVIEDAFQRAIGVGHCVPAQFTALFDAYQLVQKKKAGRVVESDIALIAAMRFFTMRLERNSELREDGMEFYTRELQAFAKTAREQYPGLGADRQREIESSAQALRRKMEGCLMASQRLESALSLPPETLSVAKLESSIEAAKRAGVHNRLLSRAEDRIFAARSSTLTIGDRPSMAGTSRPFDDDDLMLPPASSADLMRMTSDTTGWDGDFNETSDDRSDPRAEKDAAAFHTFERLRSGSTASKETKKLGWEGRALGQSLTTLEDADTRLALSINRCILGYMRDRIVFYREMLAQYVLQIGLIKSSLVDEIYLQLMKQLTKNPKRDSSIRGWSLFAMCVTSFPPSAALEQYVLLFLKAQTTESNSFWRLVRNFAAYSLKKLENLLTNGATGFIPSIEEIRGYEARPPFLCTVELLDGTPLAEQFPVTPELTVDHLVEICAHFLGLDDRFSKFLGLCAVTEKIGSASRSNSTAVAPGTSFVAATPRVGGETDSVVDEATNTSGAGASASSSYFHKFLAATTFLNGGVFLGDIFEKELIRGRELKFQLKIRLHPLYALRYEDDMFDRLMYIQVQDEIVRGNLPLLEEDAVIRFTSLAIAIDCGDDLPQTVDEMLDMNVFDYMPVEWQGTHTEEDWAEIVLDFWQANLLLDDHTAAVSTAELQRIYIEEAARHRLYGASFFPCKLLTRSSSAKRDLHTFLGAEIPSYFVLGVNCYGIHFIGRDGALLAFCDYSEIVHWGGTYNQYKITLKKTDVPTSEDVVITAKYSDELSSLLSDYKEITALVNES